MHREKPIHIHLRVGFVGAKIEKLATCVQLLNGNSKHHIKKLNTYSTSLSPGSEKMSMKVIIAINLWCEVTVLPKGSMQK